VSVVLEVTSPTVSVVLDVTSVDRDVRSVAEGPARAVAAGNVRRSTATGRMMIARTFRGRVLMMKRPLLVHSRG
jgi:hypothetical protein